MARKVPTQDRARATFEDVLRSGVELLQQRGARDLSVRELARRVGVSAGTVYQYFSSKEDLVDAIYRRQLADELHSSVALFEAQAEHALDVAIDNVLRHAVAWRARIQELDPDYYGEHETRLGQATLAPEWRAPLREFLLREFSRRRAEVRVRCPEFAVDLLCEAVGAVLRDAVLHRPEQFRDPRFARELVDLVQLYLTAPRPGQS